MTQLSQGLRYFFADLMLDTRLGVVKRGEEELPLPKLSYDLLCALVSQAPAICSREALFERVWPDLVVGEETLKQRVKLLRKSLNDSAGTPTYIEAVRGRGYRLIPEVRVETYVETQNAPLVNLAAQDKFPFQHVQRFPSFWRASALFMLFMMCVFVLISLLSPDASEHQTPPENNPHRIAVLPFKAQGMSNNMQYLVEGIRDELINGLTRLKQHQVIAKRALSHEDNINAALAPLARRLNAGLFLEGEISQHKDIIELNLHLTDTNDASLLWSQRFSFTPRDLLQQQKNITQALFNALEVDPKKIRHSQGMTSNSEAYQLYLRGNDYYRRYRQLDNKIAIDFYRQALQKDPNFALGYAGLANALSQDVFQFNQDQQKLNQAIDAAYHAISLNTSLAQGYKALGTAYYVKGWLSKAQISHQQAVKHQPGYADAMSNLGFIARERGELTQALNWHKLALDNAPQNPVAMMHAAVTLQTLGEDLLAQKWFELSHSLMPEYALAVHYQAKGHINRGRYKLAIGLLQQGLEQHKDNPRLTNTLALAYYFDGQTQAAQALYAQLADSQTREYSTQSRLYLALSKGDKTALEALQPELIRPLNAGSERAQDVLHIMLLKAGLGEAQSALRYLAQYINLGGLDVEFIEQHPAIVPLKDNPRFAVLLAQIHQTRQQLHSESIAALVHW